MENFVLPFEAPLHEIQKKIDELRAFSSSQSIDLEREIKDLQKKHDALAREIFSKIDDWDRIQLARHPQRPTFKFYMPNAFDEFFELYGDRHYGDDPAIRCGFARIGEQRFMLIGSFRGESTEEKIACHFGYGHPEGYRKALHKMKLAEKYSLPIVCMVNTAGAFPGREAEERNQSEALARNILTMTQIKVPVYCVIMSEGGSGGALGIGVGDRLDMFEYAYLSVISPEGCASILWKDAAQARQAAHALKCTSPHLKRFNLIDDVLPEPLGGAHRNPKACAATLREAVSRRLGELTSIPLEALLQARSARIRRIGSYRDTQLEEVSKKEKKKKAGQHS